MYGFTSLDLNKVISLEGVCANPEKVKLVEGVRTQWNTHAPLVSRKNVYFKNKHKCYYIIDVLK